MIAAVNVLILGLLGGNVLLALFRPRRGVAAYVLFALVAPHFHLGGAAISYEIMGFLPVGFAAFYRNGFRAHLKAEHWLWIVYFILAIAATLLSVMRFGSEVKWLFIFGWGRALFLFVLISTMLNRESIFRALSTALIINLIVAAAQLFVPGAVEVTYALYAKESQTVLAGYLERGFIPRATGTLGSPVNLGAFVLLTFAVAYERILRCGYQNLPVLVALASVMTGMLALSKSSILGIPLILILGMVFRFGQKLVRGFRIAPRRLLGATTFATIGGTGVWYLIRMLNEAGFGVLRYLRFVLDPIEAFETRYSGTEATTLHRTIDVVESNWFTGLGFTAPYNEFLGDSTYVLALHTIGVWGVVIILAVYFALAYRSFQRGELTMLLPLVALGMTGFAIPTFFDCLGVIVISYAILNH